jgi:RNA polymerase sigma-70 factor (ECF subfamily)
VTLVEGRPSGDDELVARARAGDDDAYATLVERHRDVAFRTAWLITGTAADAEDTAQEAFIKAHRALPRFRPGEPFRPWLLQIVANDARNRRRSAGRRQQLAVRAAADRPSGDAAPSPEAAILAAERREALVAGLRRLREDDRLVIGLRYFLDLGEAETAAALGVPRGTVKSRLSRALGRLRTTLEPVLEGDR